MASKRRGAAAGLEGKASRAKMPKVGKAPADLERGLIYTARTAVCTSVHDTLAMGLNLACPLLDVGVSGIVASYLAGDSEYTHLPVLGTIAQLMKKHGAAMISLTHDSDQSFVFAIFNGLTGEVHIRAARGFPDSPAWVINPLQVAHWVKGVWPERLIGEPEILDIAGQLDPLWLAKVTTDPAKRKRFTPAVSRIASARAIQQFLANCLFHPTVRCQWYRGVPVLPEGTPPHALLTILAADSLRYLCPLKTAVRLPGSQWASHYIANVVAIPGFAAAYRTKWGPEALCCHKCKCTAIITLCNTNPLLCKPCISKFHLKRKFLLDVDDRVVTAWDLSAVEQLR